MKITFYSNFLNHHQLPFCNEMVKIIGSDFTFVATERIPEERLKMGYDNMNNKYDFVIKSYENEDEALRLALESDVVIIGSAPDKYIKERIKQKKIVFRYSERVFKSGFKIKTFISILLKRTIKEKKNVYLLCASAYSARDYNLAGAYKNKTYKWGYFPEVKEYNNIDKLIELKEKNSILWVARFIEVKHPEIVIDIAKKLKQDNYDFKINMIGIGDMFDKISLMIKENNLDENVFLLGAMSPEKVREYMEKSEVFLFTSDRGEGWGAVLNESMNSACAVVASHEIGSVPFLIDNNKNGLVYKGGDSNDLYNRVKSLLDNKEIVRKVGINAYHSMINLWNSKIAAKRLVELSKSLINSSNCNNYENGPCSKASVIKDDWYKGMNNNEI